MSPAQPIPVLLLKTRSQPDDTYEEHFSGSASSTPKTQDTYLFSPHFIPVLEHTQNVVTLSHLGKILRTGELKREYGGMIFTSQRAVEAWADVVCAVEQDSSPDPQAAGQQSQSHASDPFADLELLEPFPLYVVGPATERALQTLASKSAAVSRSPFTKLNTSIHGAHTGNGANLASFILGHYEQLQREHYFSYYEAPRLPYIPLLGMSSQNYGRKRLEKDDPRLRKKPLLFLVGEVRRDVIPRTLGAAEDNVDVEEVEVYATGVMERFKQDFDEICARLDQEGRRTVRAVVVFSPQGSDIMLRGIEYLDKDGKATEAAKSRWWQDKGGVKGGSRWIVVTIGPTTRDHLKDQFGVEPDICAEKPSPEGLRDAMEAFLKEKRVARC